MEDVVAKPETALIVGVGLKSDSLELLDQSLDELGQLVESAGAIVVGVLKQRLARIVPATFIGAGKVEEIAKLRDDSGASMVILDTKLSGAQQRNLQDRIGCKVLDRQQIILDIFAQRAQTREGKLQVELAQLKDQLPRLIGEAIAGLSRLAGGIGTRGPGETKLETDRRRIRVRIEHLEKDLRAVRQTRELHRQRRQTSHVPLVALAGYTNAGKSTLLNRMTKSHAYVEDKLFATLDPTTRKLRLPSGRNAVLTDTVGFINKLPTQLVEAFKATFEEITNADIILHVHDASNVFEKLHAQVVDELLQEIGASEIPLIHVYNKSDLALDRQNRMSERLTPFANVSALTGEGLPQLLEMIETEINQTTTAVDLFIPTSDQTLMYKLARDGKIIFQEEGPHVIRCRVKLTQEALQRWSSYL